MTTTQTAPVEVRDTITELHDLAQAADDLERRSRDLGMKASARECFQIGRQLRAMVANVGDRPNAQETARAFVETAADRLAAVAYRVGVSAHGR
jgi:hypothetical protein